jgi:hypothetical protein
MLFFVGSPVGSVSVALRMRDARAELQHPMFVRLGLGVGIGGGVAVVIGVLAVGSYALPLVVNVDFAERDPRDERKR